MFTLSGEEVHWAPGHLRAALVDGRFPRTPSGTSTSTAGRNLKEHLHVHAHP
jgi:hypothetical protein